MIAASTIIIKGMLGQLVNFQRNAGSACEFSEAQKFFTLFLDDIIKPRLLAAWTGNTQQ